jgi:hypothetical protein
MLLGQLLLPADMVARRLPRLTYGLMISEYLEPRDAVARQWDYALARLKASVESEG